MEERKLLTNACSTLISDLSHIIWLREVSDDMRERENERELNLYSQEEEFSLVIYKCFQKQLKNLQKYSSLITKFREIEIFIDETEDNLEKENFVIDTNLCKQINKEIALLKKCEFYALNMGSIMHRAMPSSFNENQSIKATIVENFKKDKYEFTKGEIVEIEEIENEVHWKVRKQDTYLVSISPIFLKIHADHAEGKIIERLIERMNKLLDTLTQRFVKTISKSPDASVYGITGYDQDFSNAYIFMDLLEKKDVNLPEDWKINFNLLKKAYSILITPSIYMYKKRRKAFVDRILEKNLKLILKFEIEITDKNITNEERFESIY